ncbi:TonB-dependent receptor plug domain-containing protein [Rhodohalobacter sp. 614A]|uniref:TonB-dependent receptor plug domain-containing protein n=1 Tax=Rhodohalobacter sp. 614A TaxID=2908649 RepID=UPI001F388493|nr:TonB-dependent receptor plug domain-containing protein [Rhodohalobacter sp. 614A]
MKQILFLSIITLSLMFAGCSSVGTSVSEESGRPEGSISDDMNYYQSLADYLRQVPGVNVNGSGNNASVNIRGVNSFTSGTTPLFVIDGHAIGHSYSEANRMLNPRDIDYVRVLKGNEAAIYGVRGGNGVVEIVTRKI